ncbi:MAG: class I SAM-dependent methyltransferase [Chloroherpetonaceae bacterium]|nr:class I SAM-dependent methyltransferase [Chloroherpetonaceae bacterium]MDW8019351.1 class I SAM-dependent methyltransferase [Chloroherpetonaceae bacterium]
MPPTEFEPESPVKSVQAFWNTEACGTHFIQDFRDDKEFYDKYRAFRYQVEWHIPQLVPFAEARGKSVLEIGCGNGADGVLFAQHGAIYTGVDLTPTAVEATRKHFAVMNLPGTFQVENAESLSFADEQFDIVYSHGVLHHTPNPINAFNEVYRVLKKGGRAIIMLYHKHSFNYYVRIMLYMRARVLLKILLRLGKHRSDRERLHKNLLGIRGNSNKSIWQLHYENFLRQGWSYLKSENFVHHCTDGPECPFAYVYTKHEIEKLFSRFTHLEMKVAHFPLRKYRFGKWIPLWLEQALASKIGWYLFIFATK